MISIMDILLINENLYIIAFMEENFIHSCIANYYEITLKTINFIVTRSIDLMCPLFCMVQNNRRFHVHSLLLALS